jgi:hypothetical protein
MNQDRAGLFRKRALDAETKAFNALSEESRRAWEIVARDWTTMAEKEEARAAADLEIERLIGALVKKPQQV